MDGWTKWGARGVRFVNKSFVEDLCQAEVCDLQDVVLSDQAVLGFDVAMGLDAFGEGVAHAVAELDGEAEDLRQVLGEARGADPGTQVAAADVLQEEERLSVDLLYEPCMND